MTAIGSLIDSEPIQAYLQALEKVKPGSVKLLGKNLGRILGNDNFIDSTIPETQLPAVYAVEKLLSDNKKASILYAACSYGLAMKMISEAGYPCIRGVDIDERAVNFCTSQGIRANVMDAASTNFPNESFDLVVSRDFAATDYLGLEKVVAVLNEQHRILKPGGFAVFTTMWPMTPYYHNENLPEEAAICASEFKSSRSVPMSLTLKIPKGTVFGSAGVLAKYCIVAYQKSPLTTSPRQPHTASQSSQSQ